MLDKGGEGARFRAGAAARRECRPQIHRRQGPGRQYLLDPPVVEIGLEHPFGGAAQPEAGKDRLAQALRRSGPHIALQCDGFLRGPAAEPPGCPTRSGLAAPENESVSTTRTSTSIAVNRSMAIPPRNA